MLDARKLTVFAAARDRRGPVNVVKFSPDSKYLAAGAETECVDFYDVTNLKKGMPRVGSHVGEKASGGISTLDWSVKSLCIQADTTDFRHMVIEVSRVALPFQMTPDLSSCHFIYRHVPTSFCALAQTAISQRYPLAKSSQKSSLGRKGLNRTCGRLGRRFLGARCAGSGQRMRIRPTSTAVISLTLARHSLRGTTGDMSSYSRFRAQIPRPLHLGSIRVTRHTLPTSSFRLTIDKSSALGARTTVSLCGTPSLARIHR